MHLEIRGVPMAKQSFRFTRQGRRYQPADVERNESNLQAQIMQQLPKLWLPTSCPIAVLQLVYTFPYLKKHSKAARAWKYIPKATKPDVTDNLNKGLFDAMEGIVYVNDSQIYAMDGVRKYYGPVPGIVLVLDIQEEEK